MRLVRKMRRGVPREGDQAGSGEALTATFATGDRRWPHRDKQSETSPHGTPAAQTCSATEAKAVHRRPPSTTRASTRVRRARHATRRKSLPNLRVAQLNGHEGRRRRRVVTNDAASAGQSGSFSSETRRFVSQTTSSLGEAGPFSTTSRFVQRTSGFVELPTTCS